MANLEERRKSLGLLWVIYGVICIIKAVFVFVNINVFTLMWGALLNRVPDPYTWMSLFHIWIMCLIVLMSVTALFSFLAAGSLRMGSNPSRAITLIAGFFAIVTGPLGIAIGVYTWITFVPQMVRDEYRLPSSA
jgi:hypothetical protein